MASAAWVHCAIAGLAVGGIGLCFCGAYQTLTSRDGRPAIAQDQTTGEEGEDRPSSIKIKIKSLEVTLPGRQRHADHPPESHPPPPSPMIPPDRLWMRLVGLGCGVVAICLGALLFMIRAPTRWGAVVVALGLLSIAWEYVLIGIAVGVVSVVIAGLSS